LTVSKSEESGYLLWQLSAVDDSGYNGQSLVDSITAQRDGAITVMRSAWNEDPDETGLSGYYQTSKKTTLQDGGKSTVLGTWVKPPTDYSEKQATNFKKPGLVEISGNELVFTPGVSKQYISTVSHAFTTTVGASPTMYTIAAWSAFRLNFKASDDGEHYFESKEFPEYLGAGSWAGSNSDWAGRDVDSGSATLSSNPTTVPTGIQNIDFNSTKYLSSITGESVFRSTTVNITL
jgi:hypothetical protein